MSDANSETGPSRFRVTLFRVMLIQLLALLALWLLQTRYAG